MSTKRGYFAVGVYHPKTEENIGTLWRTASILGASFIFTIGRRYKEQASDTTKSWRHIPLFHFQTMDSFMASQPYSCPLIGIELQDQSIALSGFVHPQRAVYLLGAEDHGLPPNVLNCCHSIVRLPGDFSMNVAVAGSIVLYDRIVRAA